MVKTGVEIPNTFGMKVKADCFVEYDSEKALADIDFDALPKPVFHIGSGSNILFTGDFHGTILHSGIKSIETADGADGTVRVTASSGIVFDDLCGWAAERGLWGLENLSHIPGEVGASAVQNIGAYGVEVKDIISSVRCYDVQKREFVEFDVRDCAYAYRDSIFKHQPVKGRYVVTAVTFRLSSSAQPRLDYGHLRAAVEAACKAAGCELPAPGLIREAVTQIRRDKLPEPSEIGSAGSFFKNPVVDRSVYLDILEKRQEEAGADAVVPHYPVGEDRVKIPAAWLIEQCGWKGRTHKGAGVYEKQPLVLVNRSGCAKPSDVIELEGLIIDSVLERFGILLSPEVEHI
ncbi:MAG: UDP-N-acetylmuramate dehydrogenase [Candidatus Cryptobacteroides sp.]